MDGQDGNSDEIKTGVLNQMFKMFTGKFSSQRKDSQGRPNKGDQSHTNLTTQKEPVFLTSPSIGLSNNGNDNSENELIVRVGDVFDNGRYIAVRKCGSGVYGQVIQCRDMQRDGKMVAVKIIKNLPEYRRQAKIEINILKELNHSYDLNGKYIVQFLNTCVQNEHLLLVFELLGMNLYEVLKFSKFEGLDIRIVEMFAKQILTCLQALQQSNVIHCDIKPENVLLDLSENKINPKRAKVKIIDFGSATFEHLTGSFYVQSRFYRAPEVLLGLDYDSQIDVWSFGCMCAEMYLGMPIFAGSSTFDQICKIVRLLGVPENYMIESGKIAMSFFESGFGKSSRSGILRHEYRLRSLENYRSNVGDCLKPLKIFQNGSTIREILFNKEDLKRYRDTPEGIPVLGRIKGVKLRERKNAFVDFLSGILCWDKMKRWTPSQALQHPFVTGETFTKPFTPPNAVVSGILTKRGKKSQQMGMETKNKVDPKNPKSNLIFAKAQPIQSKRRPIRNLWGENDMFAPTNSWYSKPVLGYSPNMESFSPFDYTQRIDSPGSPSSSVGSPVGSPIFSGSPVYGSNMSVNNSFGDSMSSPRFNSFSRRNDIWGPINGKGFHRNSHEENGLFKKIVKHNNRKSKGWKKDEDISGIRSAFEKSFKSTKVSPKKGLTLNLKEIRKKKK